MLYKILFASNAGKLLIEKTILREIEDAKEKPNAGSTWNSIKLRHGNTSMGVHHPERLERKIDLYSCNKESKFDLIRRIGGDKDITINSPKLYLV
jgi:hypothetical protein